jgi:hypothetical protein
VLSARRKELLEMGHITSKLMLLSCHIFIYWFIYVLYSIPLYLYPHDNLFRLYPSDVSMFLLRVKKKGCKTTQVPLFIKSLLGSCKFHWKYTVLKIPIPFENKKNGDECKVAFDKVWLQLFLFGTAKCVCLHQRKSEFKYLHKPMRAQE